MMVKPILMRVLTEICYQVLVGGSVQILNKIDVVYHSLCKLTTGDVRLADNGQVLAAVGELTSGPGVGLLLQNLAI